MANPFTLGEDEESMTHVIARYEKEGFSGQFSVRPQGMLHCHSCKEDEPADQVPLKALHRLEGTSDPDSMAAVVGLECPSCGEWGTAVLSYGPAASADDQAVLVHLMDDREHSGIEPGL